MGDSWDETSLDVSEANPNSMLKMVDSDDMDSALFGHLGQKKDNKPSLLQAMKKSTGRSLFDDDDVKKPPRPQFNTSVTKPATATTKPIQSTPKKPAKTEDDDLLADLLGDSDYSEISQVKPPPKHLTAPKSTPLPKQTTPQKTAAIIPKTAPKTNKVSRDTLFDDDDDGLLGMLDSDPTPPKPKTAPKVETPPPSALKKSGSRFDNLLSRTSIMKDEGPDDGYAPSTPLKRDVSTPVKRGPQIDNIESGLGFTPSSGGRSRRGLSSGVNTPKSSGLRPDDTFNLLMDDDAREIASTPKNTEDIFRVDRPQSTQKPQSSVENMFRSEKQLSTPASKKPTSIEDMFRVTDKQEPREQSISRAQTPQQNRPHTHPGHVPGNEDVFTTSRPPSAGRRAHTAAVQQPQHRNSPLQHDTGGVHTPQRRKSVDSLFADEDVPNKALPWEGLKQEPAVKTPLPWEEGSVKKTPLPWDNQSQIEPGEGKVATGTPQQGSGTATQMILQQNQVLEKKISELTEQKAALQKQLDERKDSHEDFKKSHDDILAGLKEKLEKSNRQILDLEGELTIKSRDMDNVQQRLDRVTSDIETVKQDVEKKYKNEVSLMERRYEERITSMNVLLDEKEKMIQNEMKSASVRLKEKEAMLLEENRTSLKHWEMRVEETENRYKNIISELTSTHNQTLANLKSTHEDEIKQQQVLRKEEIAAVLHVQQQTKTLDNLTDKIQLSAEEISSLTNKLDTTRVVTLEEREKAAQVMSVYLHDLKISLDKQQSDISEERYRLQEVVGKMESHLREQTRQSNAAQNKLIADEARLQSLMAAWEADKAEQDRKLEADRERLERAQTALLMEQREAMENFYKERKDIVKEKARIASASQKVVEHHARGVVKQLDMESQAQAMLDQTKREVSTIRTHKDIWDKEQKNRQILVESLQKQRDDLSAEKQRVSRLADKLSGRSREVEGYSEALAKARAECVAVQQQLAKLEAELRMREEDVKIKEKALRETAAGLSAEKELLQLDRQNLNNEGIQCPACQKYRPRSHTNSPKPLRSSSPIRYVAINSPVRSSSPLSPLNMSLVSNGSLSGGRYKYPSPSVLELTGSLQRFNVISDLDKHTLQLQTDKLSRFKDMDNKILSR